MTEWSAERRAQWLYHNRDTIERDAYERGMKDAQVAQLVASMEAKQVARDPNYIDPEFKDDPSLMYDQEYIEAVYNPTVKESSGAGYVVLWIFCGLLVVAVVGAAGYVVLFKLRFNK